MWWRWIRASQLLQSPHPKVTTLPHLTAVSSALADGADVDGPGAVGGGRQHVGAAALEVEVLPVEGAEVGAAPGHAGGRPLGVPGAAQQTPPHQQGGLGVWETQRGDTEGRFILPGPFQSLLDVIGWIGLNSFACMYQYVCTVCMYVSYGTHCTPDHPWKGGGFPLSLPRVRGVSYMAC